jgi:membrane associated rhomboid family serine protease
MLENLTQTLDFLINQTNSNAYYLLIIVVILYSVYVVSRLFPILLCFGIWPRHLIGLPGIIFAPFLHGDFSHLFFNTIPLVILSDFILVNGLHHYLLISAFITVLSGILVWMFAKPSIHIGASGLITGYWGFLISNIYEQATLMSIILGLVCCYYFAGIFLGIFPSKKSISWEGHLFGLIAGLACSYLRISAS